MDMYWRGQHGLTDREIFEMSKIAALTSEELELIGFISGGYKDRHIADRLLVKEEDLEELLSTIFDKLGVSNRLELVIYAYHYGIAAPPQ